MMRCVAMFLTVGLLLGAGGGKEDAKKDLAKLQGLWTVVRVEEGGKALPAAKTKGWSLTVTDHKYVFRPGSKSVEGTYRLRPDHKPRWIYATRTDGADKGKTLHGIYELDGDDLKMCFSAPGAAKRPKAFSTSPGERARLYVFKRAKP